MVFDATSLWEEDSQSNEIKVLWKEDLLLEEASLLWTCDVAQHSGDLWLVQPYQQLSFHKKNNLTSNNNVVNVWWLYFNVWLLCGERWFKLKQLPSLLFQWLILYELRLWLLSWEAFFLLQRLDKLLCYSIQPQLNASLNLLSRLKKSYVSDI